MLPLTYLKTSRYLYLYLVLILPLPNIISHEWMIVEHGINISTKMKYENLGVIANCDMSFWLD